MVIQSIASRSGQRLAGWSGLAATLLALSGCVTCPDGSVGNTCYAPVPGQYGIRYNAPPPAQNQSADYAPGYGAGQSGPAMQPSTPPFAQQMENGPIPGVRPGHEPGVGVSYPLSPNASNIDSGDTRSMIAPTLPAPNVGEGATSRGLLINAREALSAGRTGQAQEAMKQAQTRLLDRSTPMFQTDRPSTNLAVARISEALHALGAGDRATALNILDTTIPMVN